MPVTISDPTLRDGNHAARHNITLEQIEWYAKEADKVGVDIIEVGHGNGLGASSLQLGFSAHSDLEMLKCARKAITMAKLGVHIIPGFAKLTDVKIAIDEGVDIFRVASHCTEADTTERYIKYLDKFSKPSVGVLMMSHMADEYSLLTEATKMESYGVSAVILMDSAGSYTPSDVQLKVSTLVGNLNIPVGFHAHNNLGLAVANSLTAIESGASIIDATIKGFGAGSGNTALEVLLAAMYKCGYETNVNWHLVLELADNAESKIVSHCPQITTNSIISGMHGVFSGFDKHVRKAAQDYNLNTKEIYKELGKRKVVAGQEDIILDVCLFLKNNKPMGE